MSDSDLEYQLNVLAGAAAAAHAVLLVEEEEEENRKRKHQRSCWVKQWKTRRDEKGTNSLLQNELQLEDKTAFKNFIRMDEAAFETLLQTVESDLARQDTHLRKAVSVKEKLAATLRFLATGESYKSLEFQTRLSLAFLSQEIPRICDVIYEKLKGTHLKNPSSRADWDKIASEFHSRWNFPLCIGALDGKHIAFRAIKADGAFYRNYKGYNSIVLLALVDANCRFIFTNVGCNGRVSDDGVLARCNLMEIVQHAAENFRLEKTIGNGRLLPYVIVVDNAFALNKHLMKPYPYRDLERKKQVFNYRLSRARHTVEHAFGILANRFHVLQTTINLDSHKVDSIVKACCVLHNFLLDTKDTEMIEAVASTSTDQHNTSGVVTQESVNDDRNAIQIRDEFAEYFNNEGKLQ